MGAKNMALGIVLGSPVSKLQKDRNQTGPRPEKDRTALVFEISRPQKDRFK
jgi:hypothetical protein